MNFRVHHRLHYLYSRPVFLEPQTIRLRPRCEPGQRLLSHRLNVQPAPDGLTEHLDAEGNAVMTAWFSGLTDSLIIDSDFEVETMRGNPYDFIIIAPEVQKMPVVYPDELRLPLSAALQGEPSELLQAFVSPVIESAGRDTLSFLEKLCARLYRDWEIVVRTEGVPYPPETTLRKRRAACRDLAVLFVAACRSQGVAARFVSGYQEGDPSQKKRHLHAWAEVYLPGGGWRGYDPTHGLAVADGHVAVASSFAAPLAAPVSGTFRGHSVQTTLDFDLSIDTAP